MDKVLEFKNVCFSYTQNSGRKLTILENVNYEFYRCKFYAVTGESGSGKTTTLSLAGALDAPDSGSVLYEGKDIRKIGYNKHRRNNISLIFQDYNLINYMTAMENVLLSMNISKKKVPDKKRYASDILTELGFSGEEINRSVLKLSGGQQQRVAIARALASDTGVILADEPTGNLDGRTAGDIIDIFLRMAHELNKCVIIVTHSPSVAQRADEIIELKR